MRVKEVVDPQALREIVCLLYLFVSMLRLFLVMHRTMDFSSKPSAAITSVFNGSTSLSCFTEIEESCVILVVSFPSSADLEES